mmetsp:Transcript_13658/g.18919  ORF Transcript_13658/g.18919 Transcript_13658/m.18919 type:complete len:172 (+) Transcript_13658:468-983(+)
MNKELGILKDDLEELKTELADQKRQQKTWEKNLVTIWGKYGELKEDAYENACARAERQIQGKKEEIRDTERKIDKKKFEIVQLEQKIEEEENKNADTSIGNKRQRLDTKELEGRSEIPVRMLAAKDFLEFKELKAKSFFHMCGSDAHDITDFVGLDLNVQYMKVAEETISS